MRLRNNNKSPGNDGLPIEIYKVFWAKIGPEFLNALNQAKENSKLYIAARRGLITLIPKKECDLLQIGNWRPITLLNCDYKILPKVLANRMQPVLADIIHPDQTGFMKNRHIHDNIQKTFEVVNYTYKENINGLAMNIDYQKCFDMLVDYQKCFDMLEHSAIWGSLKYFNFGDMFIEWVKLLYTDIQISIVNNGYFSKYCDVTCSTLQGSPLAAFLFLLNGQILHDYITHNKEIKGIDINQTEVLIAQFADDTTLYLQFENKVLQEVIQTFDFIQRNTGLTVNYDKTSIYRVGSLAFSDAMLYTSKTFNWLNEPIKSLGIYIPVTPDNLLTNNLNYKEVLYRSELVVKAWSVRTSTLSARVLLINTLISSLFVYKMITLPNIDNNLETDINKIILKFIWKQRRPKISSRLLCKDKYEGGLRLVNIRLRELALKCLWVPKIVNIEFWANCFYSILNNNIGELIWKCNLAPTDVKYIVKKDANIFWINVLEAWAHYNFSPETSETDFREQILWYNSCLRIDNQPAFMDGPFRAGIVKLKDILDDNNTILQIKEIWRVSGKCINWLEIFQLEAALPPSWRIWLGSGEVDTLLNYDFQIEKIKNEYKCSGQIYSKLIQDKNVILMRKDRWSRKIGQTISDKQFLNAFRAVYQTTICTRFCDFQYRILTSSIVTNRLLYLWKIKDNQLCTFCESFIEDEIHIFYACEKVKPLWYKIQEYVKRNDKYNLFNILKWAAINIIFSSVHLENGNVINFLITFAKQYIYRTRCLNNTFMLSSNEIINEFENLYTIKLNIAIHKDKMRKHCEKWSYLKDIEYDDNDNFITTYIDNL